MKKLKVIPKSLLKNFIKECSTSPNREIIILLYIVDCLKHNGYKLGEIKE